MENWCWEREALDLMSGHIETGETLPSELYEKMLAAKSFQSGLFLLRQVEFSLFDLLVHSDYAGGDDYRAAGDWIYEQLSIVRDEVSVLSPPEWNRFPNSFGHIWSGGYAAGYYSYLWAEVLSADAFSAFEEEGIFNAETGQRYWREILSQGGAREMAELFKAFRGRPPELAALLRHRGLQ